MLIKLLKDYGDFKKDAIVDTDTDEDATTLIDQGVAIKPESEKQVDVVELSEKVAKEVREELKKEAEKKEKALPVITVKDQPIFSSFGDFAKSVVNSIHGHTEPKMLNYCKSTGLNEAINADGGFLIPAEFSTALLTAISESGALAPKCLNFPVNQNLSLPFVNRTTQATSWTGGVTIYKPAEGVAKTASQPEFAKVHLKLNKMTAVVYATDELLDDSPVALETFLTTLVSTEFALTKDEDIVNGSGAGECLGIMNAPCLVSVAKEAGQPADTLRFANVAKMWARLYNPSRGKAVWLIAQDAMEQIASLSIVVGTGGGPVMVVNAATNIPQAIFGAPIIWSPHCQTVGDKGDIILADFSQYVTISKAGQGMKTATSIHLKFLENEVAFRFEVRFDGQPWWSSAVTPKHGTNTVTPFVTLDERA